MKKYLTQDNLNFLDKIYRLLVVFCVVWVMAMMMVNRTNIRTVIDNQEAIQKDLITIKSNAVHIFTNQADINQNVQDQLDKK